MTHDERIAAGWRLTAYRWPYRSKAAAEERLYDYAPNAMGRRVAFKVARSATETCGGLGVCSVWRRKRENK